MSFKLFLSSDAANFLKNLGKENKHRIVEKLKLLEDNPFSLPYRKIKGRENTCRIRIGDLRVIYSISGTEIRVLKIGRREGVYKR